MLSLAALALELSGRRPAADAGAHGDQPRPTPGLRHAVTEAVSTRRPTVALLDAAVLVIMLLTGDVRGAALTHLLVLVGEAIRARTARQTRRGTLDLGQTLGRTGWLVLGNEQVRVPTERLQPDDIVAVHTGEQVPVDGVVVAGEGRVDQRLLTGEGRSMRKTPATRCWPGRVCSAGRCRSAPRRPATTRRPAGWCRC